MPLYMSQFSYTPEAWAALTKNPEDRSQVLSEIAESVGGRLVSLYYSFGEYDGFIIFEVPDDSAAATLALAATSAGHLKTIKTTTLLRVEDALEVMRRTGELAFRAPSS